MALFAYKARDNKINQIVQGTVEAINADIAADILGEKGYLIIDLKKKSQSGLKGKFLNSFSEKVKAKDLVVFMHQLSVLISAEIPIVQSLKILEKQIEQKYFRKVISEVAADVERGQKLSNAFAQHPDVFDNFFVKMVKSGEKSGKLEDVFVFLADEHEKNYSLQKELKGAMIYPAFIMSTLFVVGMVMLIFVIPKMVAMFENAKMELPITTKILIAVSGFMQNYWWVLILLLFALYYLFSLYRKTSSGRRNVDNLLLKLPVVGPLLKKFYLTRFTRSFYTLILGGVDINSALKSSSDVVSNVVFKDLFNKTIKEVEDGSTVSSVFFKSSLIPPMYAQMLFVGEKTGKMTFVLEKITDFYTKEIQDAIKNSLAIFEPLVIVLLGIGVGVMVAAIIMPMYQLSSGF